MTAPVPVPSCHSCAACTLPASGRMVEATCAMVVDPISGAQIALKIARMTEWNGWTLPCGYNGNLWRAKA